MGNIQGNKMKRITYLLGLSLLLSACAETPLDNSVEPVGELAANDGKADGVAYSVKDYFRNTANLDLSDLIEQTVNMGHRELNAVLSSVPYLWP